MNIPQTAYNLYFTKAILGMQAIATETCDKFSRIASGIVYYGRALIQSRLYDGVCRLPRANKFVVTVSGEMAAGNIVTAITHGKAKNGEVDASTAITTITTEFTSTLAETLAQHAADIAAAMSDCYSCIAAGATTLTFIGDCDDITAVATSFTSPGEYDTAAATTAISTQDAVSDICGVSYLDHARQQQISGATYYMDTEPVNIMRKGTIWVYGEEAVVPASTVYARLLVNTANYAGYFGKSADSSKCVALVGSKYQQSIVTADLVPLIVNLPQ
jgi:hypothetical protein